MGEEHEANDVEPASEGSKDCPFCGEEIKAAAIKCRHCGERLKGRKKKRGYDAATRRMDDAANLSLIMGILCFAVCPCLAPIAIIKGNEAKKLARSARKPVPGGATAGIIIGWIIAVMTTLVVGGYALIIVIAIAAGAAQGR